MRTFPFFSLQADAKPPLKRRALGHGILQQSSAVGFVVCCGCMLPFTFQNISLPTHVNFDSGVLSDLDSSSRLFTLSQRGRGLTFVFAHIFVRAHVYGPGSQPTDALDHTSCVSRALMPTLAVQPPHVCHRQRDWAVSMSSHMQQDMDISKAPPALRSFCLNAVHVRKPRSQTLAIILVLQRVFSAPPGPMY